MSTESENIQGILSRIWLQCNQSRITDNREIIEYIAALLLEISVAGEVPRLAEELKPRRLRIRGEIEEEIKEELRKASRLAQGEGKLFDRYVLFHSFDYSQRESYPIPRHIERFMLGVLKIAPEETFADFTCGSGGFLVNRYVMHKDHTGKSIGVDISPDWVSIARANLLLHNLSEPTIELYNEDAFILYRRDFTTQFDCIAMAPPFGVTINAEISIYIKNNTSGRVSELLFTSLALNMLKEKGRAMVMVPDSLLTEKRNSTKLKQTILEGHTLRAVVSLGEGALSPFNQKNVALLLLERDHHPTVQPWLFNVENDGYLRRRNRDITADAATDNDLEIITRVLTLQDTQLWPIGTQDTSLISISPFTTTGQTARVHFVIKVKEQAVFTSIWHITNGKEDAEQKNYFFVKASLPGQAIQIIALPLDRSSIQPTDIENVDDDIEWMQNLGNGRSGFSRFTSTSSGQTVAILADGRVLGCTQTVEAIKERNYTIRPQEYFSNPVPPLPLTNEQLYKQGEQLQEDEDTKPAVVAIPAEQKSALDSLLSIKRLQHQLHLHADYLLSQLETRPFTELPPRVCDFSQLTLLNYLSDEQSAIFDNIQTSFQRDEQALYFTPGQLLNTLPEKNFLKVQHTLAIFTRLGLLAQVHINHPQKGVVTCYRLSTQHDQVNVRESLPSTEKEI